MVWTVARGAVALFTLLQAGLAVAVPSGGLDGFGAFGDKPLVVKRTGGGSEGTGSNAVRNILHFAETRHLTHHSMAAQHDIILT